MGIFMDICYQADVFFLAGSPRSTVKNDQMMAVKHLR